MHSEADVRAHRFESLFVGLAIDHIDAQVEAAFDAVNYRRPDEHGEPRVGFLAMGWMVDMCFGSLGVDFQRSCESIKALSVAVWFILPRVCSESFFRYLRKTLHSHYGSILHGPWLRLGYLYNLHWSNSSFVCSHSDMDMK